MRLVVVESPFAGDSERNIIYARRAMHDCIKRDEAPFASHLLYTQPGILDDNIPHERTRGIEAGLAWGSKADAIIIYEDYGISDGMKMGISRARAANRPVEHRTIGENP